MDRSHRARRGCADRRRQAVPQAQGPIRRCIVSAPGRETAIAVENLSKVYKVYERPTQMLSELVFGGNKHTEVTALHDVSFEVRRGEILGIVGRNGAGKSTLLKILSGVVQPSTGSVSVAGKLSHLLELG